jgi:sarcosine oxidase subunit gamma
MPDLAVIDGRWTSVRGFRGRGRDAFAAHLGFAPPQAGTWHEVEGRVARWIEPDAWLVDGAVAEGPGLLVTDLSAGLFAVRVSGAEARSVLATGCPLDLHPRAFGADACAASVFNEVQIRVRRLNGGFELVCDRALSHVLWNDLREAAGLS